MTNPLIAGWTHLLSGMRRQYRSFPRLMIHVFYWFISFFRHQSYYHHYPLWFANDQLADSASNTRAPPSCCNMLHCTATNQLAFPALQMWWRPKVVYWDVLTFTWILGLANVPPADHDQGIYTSWLLPAMFDIVRFSSGWLSSSISKNFTIRPLPCLTIYNHASPVRCGAPELQFGL